MTHIDQPWRPILAALANAEIRAVFARIVLDPGPLRQFSGVSPSRSERAVRSLLGSGLIYEVDGELSVNESALRDALAAGAAPRRTGLARFMDGDRIVRFPSSPGERFELLRDIAGRVLQEDEEISESEINRRLRLHSEDVAVLRRYLVDFGLAVRTHDGTAYRRATRAAG